MDLSFLFDVLSSVYCDKRRDLCSNHHYVCFDIYCQAYVIAYILLRRKLEF